MFKLIVLLFAVTNGVMSPNPEGQFTSEATFETQKACMGFIESEQGRESKKLLDDMLESKKGTVGVKLFCVQDKASKEDDSI
jgi:hypothetical protein